MFLVVWKFVWCLWVVGKAGFSESLDCGEYWVVGEKLTCIWVVWRAGLCGRLGIEEGWVVRMARSVSYTTLTMPTSDLV